MTDWLWSTAVYASAVLALAGVAGLIWPFRSLYRKSRLRALMMLVAGTAAISFAVVTPTATSSAGRSGLDDFAPVFHFREHHSTIVAARPERVFAAIRTVTADEIALFDLFTRIRRFGSPGQESILNAPGQQPIIDVAVRNGFHLLVDRPPQEVAIGAVVVAPPRTGPPVESAQRRRFTSEDFKALTQPGFAKATANFSVHDLGNGSSRLETETRVFATDRIALRRFTAYWRIIFPGSSILRSTWLSAIKRRAERPAS